MPFARWGVAHWVAKGLDILTALRQGGWSVSSAS